MLELKSRICETFDFSSTWKMFSYQNAYNNIGILHTYRRNNAVIIGHRSDRQL